MFARRAVRMGAAAIALTLIVPALAGCGSGERSSSADGARPESAIPEKTVGPVQIAAIQSMLAKRGFEPGPADGIMGPKTARAIASYQRDSGLPADGVATSALIRHLRGQPDTAPEVVAVEAAIPSDLYPAGTRFVYSGVEIHTVTGTAGGRVNWETSLGDRYVTGPHFGLPLLEWRSGTWRGDATSTLPPETSWPPGRGMNIYFDVTSQEWNEAAGKGAQRYLSDASWSCTSEGTKWVKVPAGSFTAQTVMCERSPAPAGDWQKRVWYYVPDVGHFVRRQDFDGAGLEIGALELIAILPGGGGSALRKGREGAIRDALDRVAPGQSAVWRNPVGPESYLIRVNNQFDGPGGKPCRTYSISQQGSQPLRDYPAVACRGKGKRRWVTPGLD